ncbi:hypothetical protein [Brachyspira pilosicoli]|uniref:Uncharacterized protein n=1 Tax=Brachyspira pilosicoli TaxID=52584 RepID=A0A5C8EQJ7_BRAPL|nr:hypothetical protein [Brachyspira pilosicoli]TXJ40135.1 hypothetical protein EPJ72_08440 [Brachyspira pilosicoli]
MKKLLAISLFISMSIALHAYETIPYMFNNSVPYGVSPDEVNQILMSNNFITAEGQAVSGTFYISSYPDPDLAWYNPQTLKWVNIKFTTNDMSDLFKRDLNLLYFNYKLDGEFKCMTITSENLSEDSTLAGKNTKWVYKFFFHNDELFAVSSRYQGDGALEQYKQRNPDNEYANPGYVMSSALFNRTLDGFKLKYGGFNNSLVRTLDDFTSMYYGNYINRQADTSLSVFYAKYAMRNINFVASYVDNYRMRPIYYRFQNKVYEDINDITDVPVGIPLEVKQIKEEDNNQAATENNQ